MTLAAPRSATARGEAPGVLHPLVVHEDDGSDRGLVLRDPRSLEHLRAAGRREPLGRWEGFSLRVRHQDALSEPDDEVPAEQLEVRVELLVTEATNPRAP